MFFTTLAVAATAAVGAYAAPTPGGPSDTVILNYALTLEHLENAFYHGALAKFDAHAFEKAGFPKWVRGRFEQIAAHEADHVAFLEGALGAAATKACQYSFPYTDPKSFAALSMILEGVGVTAYLGAAQYISNPAYLTAAGSILTTEARHAAWVGSAVNKGAPYSGPFDVPLDFDQVYSLAAPFITSCPTTNPALPVKQFASLTTSTPAPGHTIELTFKSSATSGLYLVLYSGLTTTPLPINGKTAKLPNGLEGTVYAVVSSSKTVSDDSTVAGPAIFVFPDNEAGY